MKAKLDAYIIGSIVKTGIAAMLICSLVLCTVDLLANLERYIQLAIPVSQIALRSLYYLPEALLISMGPAFLFAITYFLSQLNANNELICLLNAGIPYRRIIRPCLMLAVLMSVVYFLFSEGVGIQAIRRKSLLDDKFFLNSSSYDNRNVTLNDRENGYVLFARRYNDASQEIQEAVLIKKNKEGRLLFKMNSLRGVWDKTAEGWVFHDSIIYDVDMSGAAPRKVAEIRFSDLDIGVELFRNVSSDLKTMELAYAWEYLAKAKQHDRSDYPKLATDFYQRLLSCLTPLVLMMIACSMNYRFKKNILLFSIVFCLCIGVVYYVLQMLMLIMASQGMIPPISGMLIPFGLIILLSMGMAAALKT